MNDQTGNPTSAADATDELLPPLGAEQSAEGGVLSAEDEAQAPALAPDSSDSSSAPSTQHSVLEQALAELAAAEAALAEIGDRELELKAASRLREQHLIQKQAVLDAWEKTEGELEMAINAARKKAQEIYPVEKAARERVERAKKAVEKAGTGSTEY